MSDWGNWGRPENWARPEGWGTPLDAGQDPRDMAPHKTPQSEPIQQPASVPPEPTTDPVHQPEPVTEPVPAEPPEPEPVAAEQPDPLTESASRTPVQRKPRPTSAPRREVRPRDNARPQIDSSSKTRWAQPPRTSSRGPATQKSGASGNGLSRKQAAGALVICLVLFIVMTRVFSGSDEPDFVEAQASPAPIAPVLGEDGLWLNDAYSSGAELRELPGDVLGAFTDGRFLLRDPDSYSTVVGFDPVAGKSLWQVEGVDCSWSGNWQPTEKIFCMSNANTDEPSLISIDSQGTSSVVDATLPVWSNVLSTTVDADRTFVWAANDSTVGSALLLKGEQVQWQRDLNLDLHHFCQVSARHVMCRGNNDFVVLSLVDGSVEMTEVETYSSPADVALCRDGVVAGFERPRDNRMMWAYEFGTKHERMPKTAPVIPYGRGDCTVSSLGEEPVWAVDRQGRARATRGNDGWALGSDTTIDRTSTDLRAISADGETYVFERWQSNDVAVVSSSGEVLTQIADTSGVRVMNGYLVAFNDGALRVLVPA